MNNLHRELAPISAAAWAQIEEETSRTIKRYLAGRRVADVHGPAGTALAAVARAISADRGARRRCDRSTARSKIPRRDPRSIRS